MGQYKQIEINIMGITEGNEREGAEKVAREIMARNSSYLILKKDAKLLLHCYKTFQILC